VEIDPDEVRTHCRMSELSSFKVPERVLVVDALPKNAVGKIQKDVVRSQFWGEGRRV
jgi:non-ribosomal peptide synthetase component E (peptide arylation enzyme)